MQIIQEIKIERLVLALGITLLIADTVPHPNLSTRLVEHTLQKQVYPLRSRQDIAQFYRTIAAQTNVT